jgi:hypothetical protein
VDRKNVEGILRPGDRLPDWDAETARFGTRVVGLDVAGMRVRLAGLADAQAEWFAGRYGVFAADGARGEPAIAVEVRSGPAEGFLQVDAAAAPEIYRLATEREGDRLRCWSYRFAGWFDGAAGRGVLMLCDASGRGFESSLENYLRVVYGTLALRRGGFLLHAAGIVRDGGAHLFFGPSGSGKTTTCRLSDGARILSDDLVLVLPGGAPRAASIPFRGHVAELPPEQASFAVLGFYRLVQDQRVFLERLGPARAVGELTGSLPFVTERPENGGRILEVLGRAVETVPVFRLHFRREPSFWDAIAAAGAPGG